MVVIGTLIMGVVVIGTLIRGVVVIGKLISLWLSLER